MNTVWFVVFNNSYLGYDNRWGNDLYVEDNSQKIDHEPFSPKFFRERLLIA